VCQIKRITNSEKGESEREWMTYKKMMISWVMLSYP
jgi:hypothetical protein